MTANEPREVVVRRCGECPSSRYTPWGSGVRAYCADPAWPEGVGQTTEGIPTWCPLRERPTLVRLETNDAR